MNAEFLQERHLKRREGRGWPSAISNGGKRKKKSGRWFSSSTMRMGRKGPERHALAVSSETGLALASKDCETASGPVPARRAAPSLNEPRRRARGAVARLDGFGIC